VTEKPVIHGRDHRYGGADPIAIAWESIAPVIPPPTTDHYVFTAPFAGTAGINPQQYTVTLPTYAAGDLVLIHIHINAQDLGVADTPAGWTLVSGGWTVAGGGSPLKTALFARFMTGTEGASVLFSRGTAYQYSWHAVASVWHGVDSLTAASNNTSGAGSVSTMWTLGTLSGGFTTVGAGVNHAYWGGDYVRLVHGAAYTDVAALTMGLVSHGSGQDVTTDQTIEYNGLDASEIVLTTGDFRLVLISEAVPA
jgi:hypothetical protein